MTRRILGRGPELGALRNALDRQDASMIVVSGPPGSGKTGLVLAGIPEGPHLYHRVPPLPESLQRASLAQDLLRARTSGVLAGPAPSEDPSPAARSSENRSWEDLIAAAAPPAHGGPAVLVLDDAHRLEESRARFLPALTAAMRQLRRSGRRLHVVVVSPEPPAVDERDDAELGIVRIRVGPLPLRAAAALLPGTDARDHLRAYAIFGGLPGTLALLDPAVSINTNLRRLMLEDGAPLAEAPLATLERSAQTPTRYAAILRALAPGEGDWSAVHAGVPDVTASGQVAPYIRRLEELGMVEVRRSLDAGPRSRNRRYRVADPFLAFWFRFVLPDRGRFARGEGAEAVMERVRSDLEAHVESVLPEVCRQYMLHDAMESMASNARECGGLWGSGYDIEVAGILGSGAAFYGAVVPPGRNGLAELSALDGQIRETRYGFGRERRLRVLFVRERSSAELSREAARRHDVVLVSEGALAGEE